MFQDINEENELVISGGAIGGFIIGYGAGYLVGIIGVSVMAAAGCEEDDCQAFLLGSMTIGGAVGSMFSGPV